MNWILKVLMFATLLGGKYKGRTDVVRLLFIADRDELQALSPVMKVFRDEVADEDEENEGARG